MSENNSGEGILAFLLGGVAGAVVGLLIAPCSGDETRRKVVDWIDENRDKARRLVEKEREFLQSKKEQVGAAWEAGKKAYKETGGA